METTTFIFGSNNKNKILELNEILKDSSIKIISQSEAGLNIDADETGHSSKT